MLLKSLRFPRTFRRLAFSLASAVALTGLASAQVSAPAASSLVTNRLTQPVVDSARVTLKGTVHPLANAKNDRGAASDSMPLDRIQVVLKRSSAQESALRQLITDMHTKGSASYHKWLTPEQFGQQFGPSDQDIATLEAWLQSKGFSVSKVNPGKGSLEMSGSVAQFRTAFQTQIHKYVVDGETHYANATDPQIPAALAPVFGGFATLNNFRPKKQLRVLGKATYDPKTDKATPQWTIGSNSAYNFVLAPGDFAVQYDLPSATSGINGSGQTIAIINDSNINVANVNNFRSIFGLSANPPQVIIDGNDPGVDGINNPDGPNGDSVEAYLDVEWAGAVAPAATVDLVIGADTALESGLFLAAEHAVYGNIAPVVSLSFGACEAALGSTNSFLNSLWQQAAAQGITVTVSTGDSGSAGCDDDNTQDYAISGVAVSGYASTPYDVAVGGTDFYYSDYNNSSALSAQLAGYWNLAYSNSTPATSLLGPIPEQPWNSSQYGLNILDYYTQSGGTATTIAGGSGGASSAAVCNFPYDSSGNCTGTPIGYSKPAWQTGTGVPADGVRDIPDVSLFASSGDNASYYPECYADGDCQPAASGATVQITGVGGTSASAPAFAGIMALVNQQYGRQGQADFVLYPLAAQFPAAFHDVVNGTNSVPCNISAVTIEGTAVSPLDCIAVSNPISVTDFSSVEGIAGATAEGQLGSGTTASYNATAGYDLATGIGTVDANVLVTDWNKVTFTSTTVSLTSPTAGTSITHGAAVTFTGTVTGTGSSTPTGNVAIETNSTGPVQQGQTNFALSSGAFSGSYSLLPGGTYDVWANYGGDSTNASAASAKTQITVNSESSTNVFEILDVASRTSGSVAMGNGGSAPYGTQLILSSEPVPTTFYNQCIAASSPPSSCNTFYFTSPTGTVAFADNGTTINTAVLNAEGDAEFNGPWSVGSHSVTAAFSGDASYSASSASAIGFTIVQDAPSIAVTGPLQTSSTGFNAGQPTVFHVLVENSANLGNESNYQLLYSNPVAAPTGSVTITSSPAGISGTISLASAVDPSTRSADGVATISVPSTTASGTYTLNISYSGDSNYSATTGSGSITIAAASGVATTTTASANGSISPTTNVTITGTVTASTGSAAPTGTVELFSSGYEIGAVTLGTGSGTSAPFSAVLNSQTLSEGTNLITVQYVGNSTFAPSSTTLSAISSPLSDFSMVPNATIVPVSAGSSATDTIQLASVNGFSNLVNFTCTAASGITCSLSPTSYTFSSGSSSTTTLTINAPSGTANGNYDVLVTGTDSTGEYVHTLGIQTIVSSSTTTTGAFTLTNSGTITISSPGGGGTSTVTVTPSSGFTGTVTFSCSATTEPTGATAPTCTGSANVTGTAAATGTLTVATTALTTSKLEPPLNRLFAVGGGVALAGLLLFGIPARRRSWRAILGVLVFAAMVSMGIGCGSGGGSSGGGGTTTTGTLAGSYTLTVTGTNGSTTAMTTVSVTVQ